MYVIFINKDEELQYAINMDFVKSFDVHPFNHKVLRFYHIQDNDHSNIMFDSEKRLELGIKSLYEYMKAGERVVRLYLEDPYNTNNK